MEKDFFELYEMKPNLALEIGHNSIADWIIEVYDKRGKEAGNYGKPVVSVQYCTREVAFAKAYVELSEYFSEKFGGY
jgi:hypothetical protein